jgi:hypothetical protein
MEVVRNEEQPLITIEVVEGKENIYIYMNVSELIDHITWTKSSHNPSAF